MSITSEDLKKESPHIWNVFNILRGHLSVSESTIYVYGLINIKNLSTSGSSDEKKLWEDLFINKENMGRKLEELAKKIEENRPELNGLLSSIDFDIKTLGNRGATDQMLLRILFELDNMDAERAALVVDNLTYSSGFDEFSTPTDICELMAKVSEPKVDETIADPFCGTGNNLIQSYNLIKNNNESNGANLYGQEINSSSYIICRLRLLLFGATKSKIILGDSLTSPYVNKNKLADFDKVISVIPFGIKINNQNILLDEKYGRFFNITNPKGSGDMFCIQHINSITKHKAVILAPQGILFRKGAEESFRRYLFDKDLVESIIYLPSKLLLNTSIPTILLIINKKKSPNRYKKILFIDYSTKFTASKSKNYLEEDNINEIYNIYKNFEVVNNTSRIVDYNLMESIGWDLSKNKLFEDKTFEKRSSFKEIMDNLSKVRKTKDLLERELKYLMVDGE